MRDQAATLLRNGVALHQAGRLDEAEVLYRALLGQVPAHADALHYLGLIAFQRGRYDEAVATISDALHAAGAAAPPEYLVNYANALKRAGQVESAAAAYRDALSRRPDWPAVWFNLALLERDRGNLPGAIAALRKASTNAELPEALVELGECLIRAGDERGGFESLQAAMPVLRRRSLNGRDADACANLVRIASRLVERSRYEPARDLLAPLVPAYPANTDLLNVLGCAYAGLGSLSSAEVVLRQACAAAPGDERCLDNLAATLKDGAQHDESLAIYRRLVAAGSANVTVASNYLFSMLYSDRESPEQVLAEHRRLAAVFERMSIQDSKASPPSSSDARVRIAYLSADLRNHPVAYFVHGLLASHDRTRFRVSVYDSTITPDAWTVRLRSALRPGEDWHCVHAVSDGDLASMISRDRIDLLVDLSGHTAGNRLAALRSNPAGMQATYLGYPHSSGLPWIDWRIVDETTDPPGEPYRGTERVYRLGGSYYAYSPPDDAPPVAVAPVEKNGFLTIGVCSNLAKVTPTALDVWAMILSVLPDARFYWKTRSFSDAQIRKRFMAELDKRGIESGRVTLDGWALHGERWKSYDRIDVAVDTYPYNQATNTCEALWMGVPTISLLGSEHRSRMGASILGAAGLGDWILDLREGRPQETDLAAWLASRLDVGALCEMRSGLRDSLVNSPLLDVAGATRRLEAAYCEMLSTRQ